jgi:CTP synthase
MKYIIVYGGVISSLGKGTIASSIGYLLKSAGLKVTAIKIDPYLNIDAGTMSPFEHGEVYVLDDGGEVDLDLGNYERFLNINLTKNHNLTTGKLYLNVIQKERKGDYLGKTVQSLPHLTDYIQEYLEQTANIPIGNPPEVADVCIIELGGTTGDQEQTIYLEALSRFSKKKREDCCNVYVSLVPSVHGTEPKTKPTQLALREFSAYSIEPDILCLRVNKGTEITESEKCKLKHFLRNEADYTRRIIVCPDADNLYHVPHYFMQKTQLIPVLMQQFQPNIEFSINSIELNKIIRHFEYAQNGKLPNVQIAIVGKYTGMRDTYLSLYRALEHASFQKQCHLKVDWIDSENTSPLELKLRLGQADGILIPGGFGARGIEGMISAAQYAREYKKPILGICLGMQVMIIEVARNILGHPDANSTEFNADTSYPIICLHTNQKDTTELGGTMYLGSHTINLPQGTHAHASYLGPLSRDYTIQERYRHRYQVNNQLWDTPVLKANQIEVSGMTTEGYITIVDMSKEQFAMGCQFHPEYKSRHTNPHPLFLGLVEMAKRH